jgi:hypothetical protein
MERLRLSSDVQDLTGLPKPVVFGNARKERLARGLVARLRRSATGSLADDLRLRLLRMLAVGRRGWSPVAGAKINPSPMVPFAGFVRSSDSEDQVVRLSVLLRLMKQRRKAVDLLVDRVESGLQDVQARFWLAQMLTGVGEKKAAAAVSGRQPVAAPVPAPPVRPVPRLRYAIVMLTMFDTPVFRASLRSLVTSDYPGRIVVVEDGYEPQEQCRAFCAELGVTYLKRASWEGSAAAMNDGIAAVADETDVVVFAHNDILWPSDWFASFNRAWDSVYDGGRVGLLNLGYVQFKHKVEPALSELFLRGEYDHLRWVLAASRDVPFLQDDRIQDSQVRGSERMFGLARDPWNDWTRDVRFMTGRFSIGASFPVATWRALGGFDSRLAYGFDLELQHYCVTHRQWMLFTNNPPLIHLASSDTRSVDPARRAAAPAIHGTLPGFEDKYGWQIDHFLNIYFSESAFIYQDEIIAAANSGRFDAIDFVFDDFQQRLRERTLANCELTWCRSRTTCRYQPATVTQ